MMACTDRHGRFFLRLISRHTRLYSEMITTGAVLHGDRRRLLAFDSAEHPVALQLGGADADALASAAAIGQASGYDEINLNVGCPSERVHAGRFGVALMAEPETVARGVRAMIGAVDIPVTVKCRIGIGDQADYATLCGFIETVAAAGVTSFAVHARTAILGGLSPKENRAVPPLRYELVYRLKSDYSSLEIVLNGGVATLAEAAEHLAHVDGVMIGRAAYQTPYMLAEADERIFGAHASPPERGAIVRAFMPYVRDQLARGERLHRMTRHILGLFAGEPGARLWRRILSEGAARPGADARLLAQALAVVEAHRAARRIDRASA